MLLDLLMHAVVYAFIGGMLIGITMPLWLPVARLALELFAGAANLYARFENWRDHRAAAAR